MLLFFILTWKLLCPSDHMDQFLVSHVGEQAHHGDLSEGAAHLLTGTHSWGLGTLEQEQYLGGSRYTGALSVHLEPKSATCEKLARLKVKLCSSASRYPLLHSAMLIQALQV